jgi:hypothetical protein
LARRAEQKARARQERLAREAERAAAARRRERAWRVGAVLVFAAIVVVVAVVISSASNTTSTPGQRNKAAAAVSRLLTGIPQSGNRLGEATAENQLIPNDVRSGRVKLVFRSLETPERERLADRAFEVAVFGHRQAARRSAALGAQVQTDRSQAAKSGFNSTPTIVVTGPKGSPQPVAGDADYASIEGLVKQVS